MRRALALLVVLAACSDPAAVTTTTVSSGETVGDAMAVALLQVATVDNTFGGQPVFSELLVQRTVDPSAGDAMGTDDRGRSLTEAEMAAITEALSTVALVTWIDDPAEWSTDDLRPALDGSAILTVGEPEPDGDDLLVPVSLWCGGLCATWLTYRVTPGPDGWVVVGPEGPVTIS